MRLKPLRCCVTPVDPFLGEDVPFFVCDSGWQGYSKGFDGLSSIAAYLMDIFFNGQPVKKMEFLGQATKFLPNNYPLKTNIFPEN